MTASRKPDFHVLTPCGSNATRWRAIGDAWWNVDEHGTRYLSVALDLPPQNNRIILVDPTSRKVNP